MNAPEAWEKLSPTDLADCLSRDRVMDHGIRPLWSPVPRIAGPAYPVQCSPGDLLMLHAAIYRAPKGSVIVVGSAGLDFAVAGGNVCAIAQRRGIAGLIVDGLVRDLAQTRTNRFPVFARGVVPISGGATTVHPLNAPVCCGGVIVAPGDFVVADEEGIVVVPVSQQEAVFKGVQSKSAKADSETLEEWESAHRSRIEELLRHKGFVE